MSFVENEKFYETLKIFNNINEFNLMIQMPHVE